MSFKPAEFSPAQLQAMQWLGYRRWLPRSILPMQQAHTPAPLDAVPDKPSTTTVETKKEVLTVASVTGELSLTLNSAFTLIKHETVPLTLLLPAVWGVRGALSLWQAPVERALIREALAVSGLSPLAEILQQAQAYLDDNPNIQPETINADSLNQFALAPDCYIIFGRVLAQQLPVQLLTSVKKYWVLEHPNACLQTPMLKASLWRTLMQIKESGLL